MQRYPCYICRNDSLGGGSLVHEGMFFKLCKECMEDEEAVRLINEALVAAEDDSCFICKALPDCLSGKSTSDVEMDE